MTYSVYAPLFCATL